MKAFHCLVKCASGCEREAIVICPGKEHIPSLVDAIVFPEDACGVVEDFEVEIPTAYFVADPR